MPRQITLSNDHSHREMKHSNAYKFIPFTCHRFIPISSLAHRNCVNVILLFMAAYENSKCDSKHDYLEWAFFFANDAPQSRPSFLEKTTSAM